MLVHADHAPARTSRTGKLDLRNFDCRHHVSVIFERLDDLGPDDHLFVICGYDPHPLRRKVEDWCPAEYAWESLGGGPPTWVAEVTPVRHPRRGMSGRL